MNRPDPNLQDHLDRALHAVHHIRQCEVDLDFLVFGDRHRITLLPPDDFFRTPACNTPDADSRFDSSEQRPKLISDSPDPAEIAGRLGRRIRSRREYLEITQTDLAMATGIRRPNIARLEKGFRLPNLWTLIRICAGLNISLEELFDRILTDSD